MWEKISDQLKQAPIIANYKILLKIITTTNTTIYKIEIILKNKIVRLNNKDQS